MPRGRKVSTMKETNLDKALKNTLNHDVNQLRKASQNLYHSINDAMIGIVNKAIEHINKKQNNKL